MGRFFAWVAEHDDVYHLGTTRRVVEATYYGEQDRLRRWPAGGKVGPAEWNDVFIDAGFAQFRWPSTAELFSNWVRDRDPAPLVEIAAAAEGRNDNPYAAYNAVQCTDAPYPPYGKVRADAWALHDRRPFLAWNNVWFNAPCLFWPVPARQPVEVDGTGNRPFLLVGETLDAATPFSGSLEVRRRFPNSRLISVPGGTTHANTLTGNACVDNRIADYLLTGALPSRKAGNQADVECKAPPAAPAGTDRRAHRRRHQPGRPGGPPPPLDPSIQAWTRPPTVRARDRNQVASDNGRHLLAVLPAARTYHYTSKTY